MTHFYRSFSREKTDEQYNPTLWTYRLPTDELLPSHIALTNRKSDEYRKKMGPNLRSLKFGHHTFSGEIDVFRPDSVKSNAPIVVYIHGGWWQWFSKEQFSFLAEPFNKNGMAVYMPGYRMAQNWESNPMESIVTQMTFAVARILDEAVKAGAPAVYLVGHSAGGQLVSMLHKVDWSKYCKSKGASNKLKVIFSLAGLFDIRPLVNSFVNDEIGMSEYSANKVSPQTLPDTFHGKECPIHLVLPEFDTPEFFRQSREYQNKLLKEGKTCYLNVVSNRDHLDMVENMVEENDELMCYLLQYMTW